MFRQKLEFAEVTPDPSVGVNLMKRVARQEFLRFDLSRFNVYYLGLIVAAGLTAGVMISGGQREETALATAPETNNVITDTSSSPEVLAAGEAKTVATPENELTGQAMNVAEATIEKTGPAVKTPPAIKEEAKTDTASPKVTEPVAEKAARSERVVEYSKYQEGFRTVVPKTSYTRRNPSPEREKVNIKTVVIEDTAATREIIDSALPGKNELKGEKGNNETIARASATEGCPPLKVDFSTDADGKAKWNFGESAVSEEKNPSHTFSKEGDYKVTLEKTVSPGAAVNASLLITVYPQPRALFKINPSEEAHAGDTLLFRNLSENADSYRWDFGDGGGSDEFEPTHKYRKAGTYNVKLVVTSDYGCTDSVILIKTVSKKK